ncbi:MAG: L-seryl-tRNA(Sec) selenium transferase [Candidatus Marinimicrobia bacterium]|nr:L-seryl-tRNA(Sec) selenium transferase [Candidatus Neomarinimicrobiota bacterium]
MAQNQTKNLPSVSEVLLKSNKYKSINRRYLSYIIKNELKIFRGLAMKGNLMQSRSKIIQEVLSVIDQLSTSSIQSVINGTGIVLHTGLGRAPVDKTVAKEIADRLSGYINLEFDLESGKRGDRQNHIEGLLSALTGAQSGMVVNNNAAAVFLALNELSEGKEVIIARGQQVEIGGSFRIPDVIKKSGCIIKEVGSTNRCHFRDYENAISKNTGLILWVHTSNYVIKGFTKEVGLNELVQLGKKKRIPVMADLGCGEIVDLTDKGIPASTMITDIVKTGAGIITFSGDKLLGGPQAGLIIGNKTLVNRLKKNPIARTVRCDKWTLAFLDEALRSFGNNGPSKHNLANMLLMSTVKLMKSRGKRILSQLSKKSVKNLGISLVESEVEVGSGSLPLERLDSMALKFNPKNISPTKLARMFRTASVPVVGYINENKFFIDLKALIPGQEKELVEVINDL